MEQMKEKPLIDYKSMISCIRKHGIIVEENHAILLLSHKNYYRYKPYFKFQSESFHEGKVLSFLDIERRYLVDKALRVTVLSLSESVENYARHDVTEYFRVYNLSFYNDFLGNIVDLLNKKVLDDNGDSKHVGDTFRRKIIDNIEKSQHEGVIYYKGKYNCDITNLPIWAIVEALEYGQTIWTIKNIHDYDIAQNKRGLDEILSAKYGMSYSDYLAGLNSCKEIRNACAHSLRLYHAVMNSHKPQFTYNCRICSPQREKITANSSQGLFRRLVGMKRFFYKRQEPYLTAMLEIHELLTQNADIVSHKDYGFPDDWETILMVCWHR